MYTKNIIKIFIRNIKCFTDRFGHFLTLGLVPFLFQKHGLAQIERISQLFLGDAFLSCSCKKILNHNRLRFACTLEAQLD
jgi:hypothetical protein